MAKTIKFGVHRNPQKDAKGRDTYHVRHETDFALNQEYIISQVKTYNAAEASHINPVLPILRGEISTVLRPFCRFPINSSVSTIRSQK